MRGHMIGPSIVLMMLASPAPLTAQLLSNKAVERLEASVSRTLEEQKIPGFAIGVVKDGRLVYARGFGLMKIGDPGRPVTPQTLFHMASITKPFVATAIMQLVEHGKLDLDDPVIKHVPYFRLKDLRYKEITVRQMVTHTSGMPDVTNYYWDGGDDGFTTHLAFAPALKAGVVMMANCDHMSSLKNIWEAAMERPAPFAK
jgi:CubicO group peptidase (beta-lactamase class C family)